MSKAEKELEEKLVAIGNSLLAPPSDVDELLPLLDKAESSLSRVEQSPSESMSAALHPAMKGLVAKELLQHSEEDVKVAVASCISEITRITAPEAPYDDDLMKEIFEMIVRTFVKLDDMSSRSYPKRVSILVTVAKVRSCVVMLDLECDALILEMFQHFFRTIRDNHPESVFSSMEVVMTLVLEESEDISPELLSSLLSNVKKDAMDVLPIARRLAEKVISNCALRLKSCLAEAVHSSGASLSDYSKIVATVCQEGSDGLENNGLDASDECMADDSKFSERTVSDELAQGSGKMESEVSCPEVGTVTGRSPVPAVSNGVVQAANDVGLEPTSLKKKISRSQRRALQKKASSGKAEEGKMDAVHSQDKSSDRISKNLRIQKKSSAVQFRDVGDTSKSIGDKGGTGLPNKKRGHSKDPDSSGSERTPNKEMEQSERRKGVEHKGSAEKLRQTDSLSPSSYADLPETSRPKRGRPRTKDLNDKVEPVRSKKLIEGTKDLNTKSDRGSGKKEFMNDQRKKEIDTASDEEGMLPRKRRKAHVEANGGDLSGKHQTSKSKRKRRDSLDNEILASDMTHVKADAGQATEKNPKIMSGKKRSREQDSRMAGDTMRYDESLIGAKIKVYWPDDAQFYPGVVESYDPDSKKHKVSYLDGDVETLLLKRERFEFLEDNEVVGKGPAAASDMARKKARESVSSRKVKTPTLKRDEVESEAKSGSSARRGRPPKSMTDAATGSKPKERASVKSSPGKKNAPTNKPTDGTLENAAKLGSHSKSGKKHKDDKVAGGGGRSGGDAAKPGSSKAAKDGETPNKARRKSKEDGTPRSDGVKDKAGSSGPEAEDAAAAAKVSPALRKVAQENEGRSVRKRTKKSQG